MGYQDVEYLNREICKLYVVLTVFNITYLLRGFYDLNSGRKDIPTLKVVIISLSYGLLWDFFPVMMLMIYHYRNFKKERPLHTVDNN